MLIGVMMLLFIVITNVGTSGGSSYNAQPASREGLRKSAQPLTFTLDISVNKFIKNARHFILWGSISLYALCLFLPAFTFDKYPPTFGKTLLALGWFGILDGEFGWYANPLYPVALLLFVKRHFAMSGILAAFILGIALTSFQTKKWWVNDAVGSYPIGGYGYGFYLWLLSFAVLLIGSFTLARVSFLSRFSSPSNGGGGSNV